MSFSSNKQFFPKKYYHTEETNIKKLNSQQNDLYISDNLKISKYNQYYNKSYNFLDINNKINYNIKNTKYKGNTNLKRFLFN
mgnify:CR=1 FL=1